MARPSPFGNARYFMAKGGMPITMATIIIAAVSFIAWWAAKTSSAWIQLVFYTDGWMTRPWTLITYAFVEGDFISIVFSCLMAFFFMGALERAWGRERFLPAYFAFLVVPPLTVWIGSLASGEELAANGLWLPVACSTVAFGAYRPQSTILIFGIVPVKAMYIGLFAALAVVFRYGAGAPIAGLCVGLSMALAWLLGSRRVMFSLPKGQEKVGDEFRKSMKSKRDAEQERLRLRELLERSVKDDDEK